MSEMTLDLFMLGIKEHVRDAAVEDTVIQLKAPSGRNPTQRHVQQSKWFNQLPQSDQEMVVSVLKEAVDEALFGMFAVLDSVRTIDDDFETVDIDGGRFELLYVKGEAKILLNDPNGMDLHDEYNAITNEPD